MCQESRFVIFVFIIFFAAGIPSAQPAKCPAKQTRARAICLCKAAPGSLPSTGSSQFTADVGLGCTGAFSCTGSRINYLKCPQGKLFSETVRKCRSAASVTCNAPSTSPIAATCSSGGPTTTDGRCGAANGGQCCWNGFCCSIAGYCGPSDSAAHCDVNDGCQGGYGLCTGTLRLPGCTYRIDGRCGKDFGGSCCPFNQCCSAAGFCATSAAHCGTGCQPAAGQCYNASPSPSPKPSISPSPEPSASASPKPSAGPSPSPKPGTGPGPRGLPPGPLNIAYYESWSAPWTTDNLDLERIPAYINIVIISFALPNCTYTKGSLEFWKRYINSNGQTITNYTTGIAFTPVGSVVKTAIANLKASRPGTRVLLSVGGMGYTNFAQLNTQCLKDIVDDFGLDGIDLDYEPDHIDCHSTTTGVQCNTDNELKTVTTALRTAFPVGQYIMSAATWHVGAYGEGAFRNAAPTGQSVTGVNLAMSKCDAGQQVDLVMVMGYLMGGGYDWRVAYDAHKAAWPDAAVAIGGMIPPDEWGAPLTLQMATDRAVYARDHANSKGYGTMLWTLQLNSGCPNPQQVLQAICTTYNMGGCDQPLPWTFRYCNGNGTAPPPTTPVPGCPGGFAAGQECGAWWGLGKCCPNGMCCSLFGWCGTSTDHCDITSGCQPLYGTCTGGPVPAQCTVGYRPDMTCGPGSGGYCCIQGYCCGTTGICGTTAGHCGAGNCQAGYGTCW